jgi:hypothetical protein
MTILVCDDDKEIVEAIEIYLMQEGYDVEKAYDGIQAVEIMKNKKIDLMIIDVMMPKLDGIRATLQIRKESRVPIIILFVLCVGVGMILCTMEVFFKDVEYMYEVFCMLLFYATPIFYDVETLRITNKYAQYALMANPLYSIVSMFRDCVLFGRAMNPHHIIYSAVFSIVMLLVGVLVFYKKQDDFILHI